MSVVARQQSLDLLEQRHYPGVISSHSWATPDAYPRIYFACHTRHVRDPQTGEALSAHQASILDHLDEVEAMSMTDLAGHMGVTVATMSLAVDRLERRGYAERRRDPAEFDHPDEFDMNRVSNRHFAFGVGPHRCIGSNLARMEIKVAIERILARIPSYELAPGWTYRRRGGFVHGPESLEIVFP